MSERDITVGVLTDPYLWSWQVEALEKVQQLEGIEIDLVIIDSSKQDSFASLDGFFDQVKFFVESIKENGAYPLIQADQKLAWIFSFDNKREQYLESTPVPEAEPLSDVEIERCTPVTNHRIWNELPDDMVDKAVERTDVLIRFGFGLITGRIIEEPKFGVLSAHGSDIREARGLGPQIMFLNNVDKATVTLQQLTDDIDGGNVVCMLHEEMSRPYTLSDIWAKVREIQIDLYAEGVDRLRHPSFEPTPPSHLGEYYGKDLKSRPTFVLRLIAKNNISRIKYFSE